MEISTIAQVRAGFYRLLSTDETDVGLLEHAEAEHAVADQFLTRGFRAGQWWMLKNGYNGWRKRSSAITSWSGSDDTTGGRYVELDTICVNGSDEPDFLRANGTKDRSPLVEADGTRWGALILSDEDFRKGPFCYFRDEQLWLARTAQPPSPVYLDYHYRHPAITASVTFDFPAMAMGLAIAEAANEAKEEAWFPFGPVEEEKIDRALLKARRTARMVCRQTKSPREMGKPRRYGNHW